ncbi:MAG TPA: diacylglycerol kinase family protein [Brevefilum fermentans]|jgi:YegS/Rv2252/BmrU family lipid kinase|nr:diacylglycerol kinase family protein [Brevefilum fermentans]MDI9566786.1 diacylglycerol kinase family protein [Chloroflexota bacterium]HQA29466.1 diacylglycerol kinase family protein [Brevefilum fermentans]
MRNAFEKKMPKRKKALLFFNSKSGHSREEYHCDLFRAFFDQKQIDLDLVYVPDEFERIRTRIDTALSEDVDFLIVAGGDGTVSMVGTHLVGKNASLGIVPLGTGNLLAKALHIPQDIEQALELIVSKNPNKVCIDTFKLDERNFLLNISVGLSPKLMDSVHSHQKQRMGVFAYLIYFFQQVLGLKLHKVFIDCDQRKFSVMASEVLITNISTAGVDPLTWSENIFLDDGIMDLLIFRAANVWDTIRVARSIIFHKEKINPLIKFFKVREYCVVETQAPMTTQADGDVIGKTPFKIEVIPNSLSIIAGNNPQEN